jgi:hypothetical protein
MRMSSSSETEEIKSRGFSLRTLFATGSDARSPSFDRRRFGGIEGQELLAGGRWRSFPPTLSPLIAFSRDPLFDQGQYWSRGSWKYQPPIHDCLCFARSSRPPRPRPIFASWRWIHSNRPVGGFQMLWPCHQNGSICMATSLPRTKAP